MKTMLFDLIDLANEVSFNRLYKDINYFPYSSFISEQTDEKVVIEVELPRIKKENVKVSTSNGNLTIEITAKDKKFTKTGKINPKFDIEKANIKLEQGVLTIEIPVKEKVNETVFEIK